MSCNAASRGGGGDADSSEVCSCIVAVTGFRTRKAGQQALTPHQYTID